MKIVNREEMGGNRLSIALANRSGTIEPMVQHIKVSLTAATLKERLPELEDKLGNRRKEVMQRTGRSPQTVWNWFTGAKQPASEADLKAIADVYGVDFHELRDGATEMKDTPAHRPPDSMENIAALDILKALPEEQREMWLSLGQFFVQKYSPVGAPDPFKKPDPRSSS